MKLTHTQKKYYDYFSEGKRIVDIAKEMQVKRQTVEVHFRKLKEKGLVDGNTATKCIVNPLPDDVVIEEDHQRKRRAGEKRKKAIVDEYYRRSLIYPVVQKIRVESPIEVKPLEFTSDGWIKNVYPKFTD